MREHLGRQVAHVELALELEFETVGTVERGAVGVIRIQSQGYGAAVAPAAHRRTGEGDAPPEWQT